jgi:hypothetical protein
MLVILGISKVAGGKVLIRVRRPQHTASAAKDYGSEQKARGAILKLGIAENLVDLLFKLLPDVDENAVLSFPPLEISHDELTEEGLGMETKPRLMKQSQSERL